MILIFSTNNPHKLKEFKASLDSSINIISLKEIGINENIPETGFTLRENALQKARYIYKSRGQNCFADDTGLEIESLDGHPGVYSARYAGLDCSPEDNMDKVLKELYNESNRKAIFKTVIALILDGKEYFFEGKVVGEILKFKLGEGGFGYDPIFKPVGHDRTFAQMSLEEKNTISHRGRAVAKFAKFLNK